MCLETFAQERRIALIDLFEPFTGGRSVCECLGGDFAAANGYSVLS